MKRKKKNLEHDKKENNLIISPKWKTWNSSHVKDMIHSLEKIHELILNYMIWISKHKLGLKKIKIKQNKLLKKKKKNQTKVQRKLKANDNVYIRVVPSSIVEWSMWL
jgi:hypothetical protein